MHKKHIDTTERDVKNQNNEHKIDKGEFFPYFRG